MQTVNIQKIGLECSGPLFFAGAHFSVSTNSAALLETLASSATALSQPSGTLAPALTMHLQVNAEQTPLFPVPHFRGQHHVVVASFGDATIFVFDLDRHHITGTVSAAVEQDVRFWREKMLPIAIGIMGAAIGILPVHAACFSLAGEGLLIAGASGAGKSTLSAELCRRGAGVDFEYLADDWVYITRHQEKLRAHGSSARIKLLSDAVQHFSFLQARQPRISMNGELAYEICPASTLDAQVSHQCAPRWIFFLERTAQPGISFTPLAPAFALDYLDRNVERMPVQMSAAILQRARLINTVAELPAWRLSYGGTPAFAAAQLKEFVLGLRQECA